MTWKLATCLLLHNCMHMSTLGFGFPVSMLEMEKERDGTGKRSEKILKERMKWNFISF